jgi:hypothetical protein
MFNDLTKFSLMARKVNEDLVCLSICLFGAVALTKTSTLHYFFLRVSTIQQLTQMKLYIDFGSTGIKYCIN